MTTDAAARLGTPAVPASHHVAAVRYATRPVMRSEAYYGWELYGEPDARLEMAYFFWILQRAGAPAAAPIVVDCGFDIHLGRRLGRESFYTPGEALFELGVEPARVQRVVVTHMHYDHIGNLGLFPNARLSVARRDFDFWTADPVARRGQFSKTIDPAGIEFMRDAHAVGRVDLIDGDGEIAPGLRAVVVGGHSPGQLMLEVDTPRGGLLMTSDAVHYHEELDQDRPFETFSDLADVYRAYDRVKQAAREGQTLLVGHDPAVMERFPAIEGVPAGLGVQVA
jgi:glyoxylase-like metal-dependent hydrolase (beta-lactamase superfamily II)